METKQSKVPVLAVACGGTGGHFFPGLSVAREFQRRGGMAVLFIGGHHASEQIMTAQAAGVHAVPAPAVRVPKNVLKWPFAAVKFLGCLQQNKSLLSEQRVDLALVMGSFASVPMGLAASRMKIPLVVHEGNARMGRANRYLSKRARKLFLSFPLYGGEQTAAPQQVVGMPTRQQLRDAAEQEITPALRAKVCERIGLSPDLPIMMVFGGSQGAKFFNQLMPEAAALLRDQRRQFQLIHLTGSHHNEDYDLLYKQIGLKSYVAKRESRIELLFQVADLVLCRAGASTVFELALFGKPAIFVPYPDAMDDHQKANAQTLVDHDAALMLPQKTLTPQAVVGRIEHWLAHRDEYEEMGQRLKPFARPLATMTMVDELCKLIGYEAPASEEAPAVS